MGGLVWPFLNKNAIFRKCSDWLETFLKRCGSTKTFEWCNFCDNPLQPSKVIAKLLKSYYACSRRTLGPTSDVRRRLQKVVPRGLGFREGFVEMYWYRQSIGTTEMMAKDLIDLLAICLL